MTVRGGQESEQRNRSTEKLFLSLKGKRFQYCKIKMYFLKMFVKMLLFSMARVGQNVGYDFELSLLLFVISCKIRVHASIG